MFLLTSLGIVYAVRGSSEIEDESSDDKVEHVRNSMKEALKDMQSRRMENKEGDISRPKLDDDKLKQMFKAKRVFTDSKLAELKQEKERIHALLQERKQQYHIQKDALDELKKKLNKCRNSQTEECEKIHGQSLQEIKDYLLKGIELANSHLDKLSEKVSESTTLTSVEIETALARIKAAKTKLAEYTEKIKAAQDLTTLKAIAKELHKDWGNYRGYGHFISHEVVNRANLRAAYGLDNMLTMLKCAISDAQSQGKDVTALEEAYSRVNTNIQTAKQNLNDIQQKIDAYQAGDTNVDIEALKEEAKDAQETLQKAYAEVKEIMIKLADSGIHVRDCIAQIKKTAATPESDDSQDAIEADTT